MEQYKRINWEDAPSEATPLDAHNLNHMEDGIDAVTNAVIDVEKKQKEHTTDIDTLKTNQATHSENIKELQQSTSNNANDIAAAFVQMNQLNDNINKNLEDNFYNADEADEHFLSQYDANNTYVSKETYIKKVSEIDTAISQRAKQTDLDNANYAIAQRAKQTDLDIANTAINNLNTKVNAVENKITENLLIINDFDETFNGVNIRIVNNHITLSGTCTASGGININCRTISVSGVHILSAQNCTTSTGLSATLAKDNVTISDTALSLNKTGNISSVVSNFTFNQIRLYFTKDRVYEKEFDIQLEIGEELRSFVAPSELSRLSNITENMLSSDLQKKLFTISFDDETGELNILTNEVL